MSTIRVLVVDDSVVQRRVISDALSGHSDMEVVGGAMDGLDCLAKIESLSPDIVILDLQMPRMSGLEAIPEIRKRWPRLPVIIFSTLAQEGAKETIAALSLGASDYLCKPSARTDRCESAIAKIRSDMLPKIRGLCGVATASHESNPPARAAAGDPSRPASAGKPQRPRILAIGSSTGGPQALAKVIGGLRQGFPIPIVITQHMPPKYTRALAERLSQISPVPIHEAEEGMQIRPGNGYMAPGDFHLIVQRNGRVHLDPRDLGTFHRPAVDPMFESIVGIVGGAVLAAILTGMGSDGRKGAELIHNAGGTVIAQDEETSVVWGMPGSVVRAGFANLVLPIHRIADEINQRVATTVRA